MKEKEINRLYLSGIVSKTVARSQMVNWANVLKEHGIKTRFIVFCRKDKERKAIEMFDKENDYDIIYIPSFFLFREVFIIKELYKLIKQSNNKLIIQTRSISFAYALAILRTFNKVPIIFDIRGAGEFDYEKSAGLRLRSALKETGHKFKRRILCKISDKIFCVSNQLKKYIISNYLYPDQGNKIEVIYGAASEKDFYFNPEIRIACRNKYGLNEKIVILYSGKLDKPWQVPYKIFELFLHLKNTDMRCHLFLLTPDTDIAFKFREKYHIEENDITILESGYSELNSFLNGADYGLLLRENKLVNNVAAPSKFSEYLLSGLPVIISKAVGDYSDYIAKTGYGVVIDDLDRPDIIEDIYSGRDTISFRNKISSDAKLSFSKEVYVEKLKLIYSSL